MFYSVMALKKILNPCDVYSKENVKISYCGHTYIVYSWFNGKCEFASSKLVSSCCTEVPLLRLFSLKSSQTYRSRDNGVRRVDKGTTLSYVRHDIIGNVDQNKKMTSSASMLRRLNFKISRRTYSFFMVFWKQNRAR